MSRPENDDGFTLVEMLVGLLVLSLTAVILSSTMGTAFKSYQSLRSAADGLQADRDIRKALERASSEVYFESFNSDFSSIELGSSTFEIFENNQKYTVGSGGYEIFTSDNPVRFSVNNSVLKLEVKNLDGWEVLLQVPRGKTVEPFCRYDVVGRRCR